MDQKVTDHDIHSLLDKFGSSGEESFARVENSKTSNNTTGSVVWFVDPLKVRNQADTDVGSVSPDEKCSNALSDAVLMFRQQSEKESDEDGDVVNAMNNEWFDMFGDDNYIFKVRELAASCQLEGTSYRSICWRIFWECLPEEQDEWINKTLELREEYNVLMEKHLKDPYEAGTHHDLTVNNPLSQSEDSPWHQYFQDNQLKTTLNQDLDRLFPDHHFFQKDEVKNAMMHILFCFAKEHPRLTYRQGMHEILACVIHVFWNDYVRVSECEQLLNEGIPFLHDLNFLEHDCYHLFRHIMDVIEPWYVSVSVDHEAISRNKATDPSTLFISPPSLQATSAIIKKLNRIQNYMLKRYDLQLFAHLSQLDIQPQLYGIRWLRLLFGREFDLNQLPIIWDVLFSQGITLDFADFFYLAMLTHIRGLILKADYATCLSHLMKYPCSSDLRPIVKKAFHLRQTKPKPLNIGRPKTEGRNTSAVRKEHPVKTRLKTGATEEQRFASVLGSGGHHNTPKSSSKVKKGNDGTFYDQNDKLFRESGGIRVQEDSGTLVEQTGSASGNDKRSEFVRESIDSASRQGISSQLSNVFAKHKVGSPGQMLAKLATKTKAKSRGDDVLSQLAEDHQRLQKQVSLQQMEIDRVLSLNVYCGEKMEAYLDILQRRFHDREVCSDETVALCLAGLKQIRDFLRESAEFRGVTSDLDIDLGDIDRHLSSSLGISQIPKESFLEKTHCEKPIPFEADYGHFDKETRRTPETTRIVKSCDLETSQSTPTHIMFQAADTFKEDISDNSEVGAGEFKDPLGHEPRDTDASPVTPENTAGRNSSLSPTSDKEIRLFDEELSSISSRFKADEN